MAELGKLLTFMFKEDRAEILAHYNELFDNAEDEEALMREFGSPTKLAVSISRSYDREERKLTVSADEKGDAQTKPLASAPQQPAAAKPEEKSNDEFTGTYAEIVEEFRRQRAIEEGTEYTPIFFDEPQAEESVPVEEAEAVEAAPIEQEPENEAPSEDADEAPESADEAETSEEVPEEAEDDSAESESEEEAEIEDDTAEENSEESPEEGDAAAAPEDPAESEEVPEEAAAEEVPEEAEAVEEETETLEEKAPVAVKKTNIPLLILYVILAVPVGIVGIVLTVVIGAAVIVCAALAAAVGIKMFTFAFSGVLSLLADIFMAGGFALIAVALAVLLLWLGVWCVAAGVPGIVSGLRSLGRSLCVKEVYVDG